MRGSLDRLSGTMRNWLGRFGSVVHLMLWINVFVFLAQLVCLYARWDIFERWLALSADGARHGMVWQFVTYMFLHQPTSLFHILVNLLILWFFGREVEYFIGPKFFTRLYLLSGVFGGLLWLAFHFHTAGYLLGASAGVLACVIAFATLFPDREITFLVFFVLPVTIKAKYMALIAVALNVVPLLSRSDSNVAYLAHLGGAAFGYFFIKYLGYGTTPRWVAWLQTAGKKRSATPRPISDEEYIRQKVDPILDKIAREGMQSLTRAERKILASAKDHVGKRQR